jgi:hypothetical protein
VESYQDPKTYEDHANPGREIELEQTGLTETDGVTPLAYRVVR